MIRIYRCIIAALMVAAIGFGVWYCIYTYDEQRSIEDGTLVLVEKQEESRAEYEIKGVWKDVSDYNIY